MGWNFNSIFSQKGKMLFASNVFLSKYKEPFYKYKNIKDVTITPFIVKTNCDKKPFTNERQFECR